MIKFIKEDIENQDEEDGDTQIDEVVTLTDTLADSKQLKKKKKKKKKG